MLPEEQLAYADDELTRFARWWLEHRSFVPPGDAYMQAGCNTGLVLFRQPPWQVQLFICAPDGEIVDHSHPHVDSYEIYVTGDVYFRHRGKTVLTPEMISNIGPMSLSIRVLPTDLHGGSVGPRGGSFISIQHWIDREPSSVHLSWDGPPLDQEHQVYLAGIA
jgi:hypothetical protein